MRELAEAAGILIGLVGKVLYKDLGIRKLTAKYVLRLLTIVQKRQRVCDSKSFLHRLVPIDET